MEKELLLLILNAILFVFLFVVIGIFLLYIPSVIQSPENLKTVPFKHSVINNFTKIFTNQTTISNNATTITYNQESSILKPDRTIVYLLLLIVIIGILLFFNQREFWKYRRDRKKFSNEIIRKIVEEKMLDSINNIENLSNAVDKIDKKI